MTEQTAEYLVLKPLSDRIKELSSTISDEQIKCIITDCIKEKIEDAIDFSDITEIVEEYIDNNHDDIEKMIVRCLGNKLK